MRNLVPFVAALLLTAATGASADSPAPGSAPQRNRAVMLYFTKSFGSTQRQNRTPLAFGLRMQQSASFDPGLTLAMADLRYSLGGRQQLLLGGLNALEKPGKLEPIVTGDISSISRGKWLGEHKVATAIIATLVIAGGMCAARKVICEKNAGYQLSDNSPSPEGRRP